MKSSANCSAKITITPLPFSVETSAPLEANGTLTKYNEIAR